jgi:hypothetical protein
MVIINTDSDGLFLRFSKSVTQNIPGIMLHNKAPAPPTCFVSTTTSNVRNPALMTSPEFGLSQKKSGFSFRAKTVTR